MKVVVTGASGLLGGNLALELLARGHTVSATRRASSKITHLADRPIEWVDAALSDQRALTAAFRGADAVFHCAAVVSIRSKVTKGIRETNVEGTRHVVRAATQAKVLRLVHCSSVSAVGLSEDGRPCTESSRWNFDELGLADGYTTTKRAAESVVASEGTAVDWVVVNPTYMIGPNDAKPSSGKLIIDIATGKIPGWTPGWNNFVDVRDVARGMILAHEQGKRGERYILGGEDLPFRDIMARMAQAAGVKAPSRQIPRVLAKLLGLYGDLEERLLDREPLLNSASIAYGFSTGFRYSSAKAEAELGYTHGPIEPALRDAVAYFRQMGMLKA